MKDKLYRIVVLDNGVEVKRGDLLHTREDAERMIAALSVPGSPITYTFTEDARNADANH